MVKPRALLRGGAVVQAHIGAKRCFSFGISARHIRGILPLRSRICDVRRLEKSGPPFSSSNRRSRLVYCEPLASLSSGQT